jgi:hypothetical protein
MLLYKVCLKICLDSTAILLLRKFASEFYLNFSKHDHDIHHGSVRGGPIT